MHFQDNFEYQCKKSDKEEMKHIADTWVKKLDTYKKEILQIKSLANDKIRQDRVIKDYGRKIEELKKKGIVDENEFCGYNRDEEDDDDIGNYDRTILRNEYENNIILPYQRMFLYRAHTFGYQDSKIKYF